MPRQQDDHDLLAANTRWQALVAFIRQWVGPFDGSAGMAPERLDAILQTKRLELPAAIREWYLLAGAWSQGGLSKVHACRNAG